MAVSRGNERLRLTTSSAVAAVALLGLTLVVLRFLAAASGVIVWVLAAMAAAGLLYPVAVRLSRLMPYGLAVAAVALFTAAIVGALGYGLVEGLVRQTHVLQRAAPARAERLEASGRFSAAARELRLADRTRRFVADVPGWLRGGTPSRALRDATRRGLAFLVTAVLTLFFLLHGPRLAAAAARQIHDPVRRARLQRVMLAAYRRGFGYMRGTLLMALASGLLAYALARATALPGPVPLALWVALWDMVPLLGEVVGALPVVALAAVRSPTQGLALVGVFVAYQFVENLVLQRRVEQATVRVGPFLTAAGGFAGLELYGVAGALLAVLALALGVAVAEELATPGADGSTTAAAEKSLS